MVKLKYVGANFARRFPVKSVRVIGKTLSHSARGRQRWEVLIEKVSSKQIICFVCNKKIFTIRLKHTLALYCAGPCQVSIKQLD
jgi:hypothetical protein